MEGPTDDLEHNYFMLSTGSQFPANPQNNSVRGLSSACNMQIASAFGNGICRPWYLKETVMCLVVQWNAVLWVQVSGGLTVVSVMFHVF